jgi:hypothetical protein
MGIKDDIKRNRLRKELNDFISIYLYLDPGPGWYNQHQFIDFQEGVYEKLQTIGILQYIRCRGGHRNLYATEPSFNSSGGLF